MFSGGFFWFLMGLLFVLVAAGVKAWTDSLGIKMSWWKWLLALLWYGLLNFAVALPMTFVGENETGAALKAFLFLIVITVILGVGLWRLLLSGRRAGAG